MYEGTEIRKIDQEETIENRIKQNSASEKAFHYLGFVLLIQFILILFLYPYTGPKLKYLLLTYPYALYISGALLLFNPIFVFLRTKGKLSPIYYPFVIVAFNIIGVTLLVAYTGGYQSDLWLLYLIIISVTSFYWSFASCFYVAVFICVTLCVSYAVSPEKGIVIYDLGVILLKVVFLTSIGYLLSNLKECEYTLHSKISQKEEEIKQTKEHIDNLIRSVKDCIVSTDTEGKIILINKAGEEMFDYTGEELKDKDISILYSEKNPPALMYEVKDRFLQGDWDGEMLYKKKNGETFPAHMSTALVRDWRGKVEALVSIIRDVTKDKEIEQKRRQLIRSLKESKEYMEKVNLELEQRVAARTKEVTKINENLRKANEKLQELDRLKSEFLANMSHELRTPLTSVIGYSQLLLSVKGGELPPKKRKFAESLLEDGKNLLQLVNDILDLSKLESGKMKLSRQSIKLTEIAQKSIDMITPLVNDKGIDLIVSIPAELPNLNADPDRVRQIINNLLSNAVKFTPKSGKITIEASEKIVRSKGYKSFVEVKVKDTGIGMPNEVLDHIFDKFYQVDGTTTRSFEGTGLGLSIVRNLVELHGGEIKVDSEIGTGSCFTFIIPVAEEEAEKIIPIPTKKRTIMPEEIAESNNVLVVEDDPYAAQKIATVLKDNHYNPIIVDSGQEAINLARSHKPVAITLDILLPDIHGWEILYLLKKSPETSSIPVIIISVIDNKEYGYNLGAFEYLTKPIEEEFLLSSLGRISSLSKIV